MPAYLLTWNPKRWAWDDIHEQIAEIERYGNCFDRWSCGNTKKILAGDRVFLIQLGQEPRGIFGSGKAETIPYEDIHWEDDQRTALYIDIVLDVLLDPEQFILPIDKLESDYPSMLWSPQSSGTTIPDEVLEQLETDWARFLASIGKVQPHTVQESLILAEEIESAQSVIEGATKQITVTVYERNADARRKCIEHYGLNCCICGFNFEKIYGEIGIGFIHVHHLKPLSEIGSEYELDPIRDLRPVCPNCHAMIHKGKKTRTIEEMQELIQRQRDTYR